MPETLQVRVSGSSMYPCLMDGDILTVERAGIGGYTAGDVIVYLNVFGEKVCHRIIGESIFGAFITSGDNQRGQRDYVYPLQVLGKAVSFERRGQTFPIEPIRNGFYAAFVLFVSVAGDIKYLLVNRIAGGLLRFAQRGFLCALLTRRAAALYGVRCEPEGNDGFRCVVLRNWKAAAGISARILKESEEQSGGCWLYGFHVPWQWRYSGIEEKLVRTALEEAKKKGSQWVRAVVPYRDRFSLGLFRCLSGREPERFNGKLAVFTFS